MNESISENQEMASNEAVPETLTQDQINKIVVREKTKAAEKAAESVRRELEEKHQREIESLKNSQYSSNTPVNEDALYQKIQERFNRELQEHRLKTEMEHVANNYVSKVNQAKQNYSDFDEVTKDFDPSAFPQISYMLAGIENGGDVLYDLSKNPLKLAGIDRLAEKNPKQAQVELMKLSKSISDNKSAIAQAKGDHVNEPFNHLAPSPVTERSGDMSIQDLRAVPWLR